MSTSILYHGFGIIGYHHVRTFFKKGAMFFKIIQQRVDIDI